MGQWTEDLRGSEGRDVEGCRRCRRSTFPPCPSCTASLLAPPDLPAPHGLVELGAVFSYSGAGARLVTAWKYGNDRRATGRFTSAMATVAPRGPHDVVTWAPTSAVRRRERGFDPARLLAAGVATRRHVACRELLSRLSGPAQTGRSASERREVTGFEVLRPIVGRVLLVDDVCTTGSTLAAAAEALLAGGAGSVDGVVLARTPTELATP